MVRFLILLLESKKKFRDMTLGLYVLRVIVGRWLDTITNSVDMNLSKLRDGEGQGSLACCLPRDHKEYDTT